MTRVLLSPAGTALAMSGFILIILALSAILGKHFSLDSTKKRSGGYIPLFTALCCMLIGGTVGCSSSSLPTVSSEDIPLQTLEKDGYSYNVYNDYIGLIDCTLECGSLELPKQLDGLTVARLEDGFLQNRLDELDSLTLPDTIVYIGAHALTADKNTELSVKIPKSVKYIGSGAFSGIDLGDDELLIVGDGILLRCNSSSESVTLPSGVKLISSAFESNKTVKLVNVNKGCTEIISSAFAFSSVREVRLPDSIEKIGSDCFRKSALESIRMPSGDCEIGKFAFEGTSDDLVLVLTDKSDAFLYAIENELKFRLEDGDGSLYASDKLEAVGVGTHEFSVGGEGLKLELSEKDITPDKKRAAVLIDHDADGIHDLLVYLDLRTLRATDTVSLGKDGILAALEAYTTETRDYSAVELSGELSSSVWKNGVLALSGKFTVKYGEYERYVTAALEYSPNSGYLTLNSITTDSALPNQLSGYELLASSSNGSARLYGKRSGDGFVSPLAIRWTFGNINLETESFSDSSSPELLLSDINGDGMDDLILRWYPEGSSAGNAAQCAEVFLGPTGAKRFLIDPLSDFEKEVSLSVEDRRLTLKSRFGSDSVELEDISTATPKIGGSALCSIVGDRLVATLCIEPSSGSAASIVMVYGYSKSSSKVELESIFTATEAVSLETENALLCHIGRKKLLLCTESGSIELDHELEGELRLSSADLDGDGISDPIVTVISSDETTNREELYVLTSSNGRLQSVNAASDMIELYSITRGESGFIFESRFASFELPFETFAGLDPASLDPRFDRRYSYLVENDILCCDLSIGCASPINGEFLASETTVRLTYRFDTIFRVKTAELLGNSVTVLSMSFSELIEQLTAYEAKGKRNDTIKVTLTDRGEPTLEISFEDGHPTLTRLLANDQTLIPDEPMKMLGSIKFDIFTVEDCVVVESLYYDLGDTYIITKDSILRFNSWYGQSTDDYLVFFENDGRLAYKRIATRYNSVDLGQFPQSILDSITSRDDFYCESGAAEVIDGEIALTPNATQTISQVIDLDKLFSQHRDYVASYKTLDDVIARNLGMLSFDRIIADMSLTLSDFKAEIGKMLATEEYTSLRATITDADNAVLTVEKNNYGTTLRRIEARANIFEPTNPIVFDDSPELTLFASGKTTVLQVLLADGSRDRYIFCDLNVYEEHDTAEDVTKCRTLLFTDSSGAIRYTRTYSADPSRFLKTLMSRSDIFSESGYIRVSGDVSYIAEKSTSYAETFDLDAEFEGVRESFSGVSSVDQLISLNLRSLPTLCKDGAWELKAKGEYYFLTDGERSFSLGAGLRRLKTAKLSTSLKISGDYAVLIFPSSKTEQSAAIIRLSDGKLLDTVSAVGEDFELLKAYSSKLTSVPSSCTIGCEVSEYDSEFKLNFALRSTDDDILLETATYFHTRAELLESEFSPVRVVIGKKANELLPYYEKANEVLELLDVSGIVCDLSKSLERPVDSENIAFYYKITDERFTKKGIDSIDKLKKLLSEVCTKARISELSFLFEGQLPHFIDSNDGLYCLGGAYGTSISIPTFTASGNTLFVTDHYLSDGCEATVSYGFVSENGGYLLDSVDRQSG